MKKTYRWIGLFVFVNAVLFSGSALELRILQSGMPLNQLDPSEISIFIDGQPKAIESISRISKNRFEEKRTGKKIDLKRNFILMFSMQNISHKLNETIDYFFNNTILPGDSLSILTPLKTYNLKSAVLRKMPKRKIASQLKKIVYRDIKNGTQYYQSLLNDTKKNVKEFSFRERRSDSGNVTELEYSIRRVQQALINIEQIRQNHQKKMIDFLKLKGRQKGQNIAFLFYDREFLPTLSQSTLRIFKIQYRDRPDVLQVISSTFEFYKRDMTFDEKELRKIFLNKNLLINGIFFKEDSIKVIDVRMTEKSEDMYELFTLLAKTSGGMIDNSSNLLSSFKKILDFSENYFFIELKDNIKTTPSEIKIESMSRSKLYFRLIN